MPYAFKQSGLPSTRRIVFVALLVVSLLLTSMYARESDDGMLHSVQNSVMQVLMPLNRIGAAAGVTTNRVGDTIADMTASADTLTALREQNQELRRLLANTEEYRQEAERLQALWDMRRVSGVTGVIANVVGRSANAWDQSITIDMGTSDGVETGMTIMGATGVIGQVTRVSDHSATVRLLTDPNSGAAVIVQSTRANAVVRGSLSGLLYLEDVEDDQIPIEGDVILTSGLGGSYAPNLIVGAVVSVTKTPGNSAGTIIVNPNDSARVLEQVIVVMPPDVIEAHRTGEGE